MGCSHAGVPLRLVFTTVAGFVSDQQVCEVKAMLGRERVLLGYFTSPLLGSNQPCDLN